MTDLQKLLSILVESSEDFTKKTQNGISNTPISSEVHISSRDIGFVFDGDGKMKYIYNNRPKPE